MVPDEAAVPAGHHPLPSHYTHDGSFNHPLYPLRGSVGSKRIRKYPPLHSYRRNRRRRPATDDDDATASAIVPDGYDENDDDDPLDDAISNIFDDHATNSSSSHINSTNATSNIIQVGNLDAAAAADPANVTTDAIVVVKDDDDGPLWHHPRIDLPSARDILVKLFQHDANIPRANERANQLLMFFGHFVTHDLSHTFMFGEDDVTDITIGGNITTRITDRMDIECDLIETRGPFCQLGRRYIDFYRSPRRVDYDVGGEGFDYNDDDDDDEEEDDTGEPINYATTWLDMDHVYGNMHPKSSNYLKYRTGTGGRMLIDDDTRLPPLDENTGLYTVYDDTMRRLPSDLVMVSTFLHYHNLRASHHEMEHPEYDDEALYHMARMDVISVYQNVFEENYVPAVLGMPLSQYAGYDVGVDSSIDVFFSTCSFRYGHSGVSGVTRLLDSEWEPLPQDPILMRDLFDDTERLIRRVDDYYDTRQGGGGMGGGRRGPGSPAIMAVLRGLTHDPTHAPDASFVDDMSLFMAGSVAKNIQRGRDNGLPSYNEARAWFGLEPARSYLDLANGTERVAQILEELYGVGNIDDVDAYVGAMLEVPSSKDDVLGALNLASMRDQWERLRNGDRLYYRNRLTAQEIQALPTFADLVREVWGAEEMQYFPDEIFAIVGVGGGKRGEIENTGENRMELFEGDLLIEWEHDDGEEFIDFTMTLPDQMINGGYIGLGWGSNIMKGAEMWMCLSIKSDGSSTCDNETAWETVSNDPGPFSCCVVDGERHIAPDCSKSTQDYLTVLSSCSSGMGSYVSVRARVCPGNDNRRDCFVHEGNKQFIAAFNPDSATLAHGFSRRQAGSINLVSGGAAATCSNSDSARAGLFALHGTMLLIAWLVLAPIAIYVVRYYKGKSWRLKVHITLVGVIVSMMFTLILTAVISVEGTSFGTEDARSAKFSKHKIVGMSVFAFIAFMVTTGELRRKRTLTKRTKSVALERAVIISHRCGGLILVGAAWYNCYTGLVQIGPYESDSVEITFFSSKTVSLGYDLEFFGFFRKYLFFPWLAMIFLVFIVTEVRTSLANKLQVKTIAEKGSFLNLVNEKDLPSMSLETFLFLTRHGSELSIIDGHVVDISAFIGIHPGGANVLRFASGSDITPYFTGMLDINGQRHTHSSNALGALRPLVKWKLESESKPEVKDSLRASMTRRLSTIVTKSKSGSSRKGNHYMNLAGHVFRNAEIVGNEVVSVGNDSQHEKCVVKLSISMDRNEEIDILLGTPMPTSTFIFRHTDDDGIAFERPYTASRCYARPVVRSNTLRTTTMAIIAANIAAKTSKKNNSSQNTLTTSVVPTVRSRDDSMLPLHSSQTQKSAIIYEFFISLVVGGKMSSVLSKKKIGRSIMVKGPMINSTFMTKLNQQPWSNICLIVQGSGITPGLQLIDYFLQMNEPPRISLVWCVKNKNRHSDFVESLKLGDLEKVSSDRFHYIIVDYKKNPTQIVDENASKFTGCDEKENVLQLCHSRGIYHQDTVDAVLVWAGSKGTVDVETPEDCTHVDLHRIGESLRCGLLLTDKVHKYQSSKSICFRGCDAVSFIVSEEYTPSRESALALGRELASKLKLFKHTSDEQQLLYDSGDEYYKFCENSQPTHLSATPREGKLRSLHLSRDSLLAVCGYVEFEKDVVSVLKKIGATDDQIFQFPGGDTPLSALSQYIPERKKSFAPLTNLIKDSAQSLGDETKQTHQDESNATEISDL